MIDLDCIIKSLRMAWLERIFTAQGGTWRNYLRHVLVRYGGLFFLIVIMILMTTHLVRYTELLQWWSEFRDNFASTKDWVNTVWNNKDIRVNEGPVFYKNYFEGGMVFVYDLLFHLNNTDSFKIIENKRCKTNFLIWTGLRHSVPKHLKDNVFDVTKKKSKHFYPLLLNKKA